jgi:hypothetical protein
MPPRSEIGARADVDDAAAVRHPRKRRLRDTEEADNIDLVGPPHVLRRNVFQRLVAIHARAIHKHVNTAECAEDRIDGFPLRHVTFRRQRQTADAINPPCGFHGAVAVTVDRDKVNTHAG